MLKGIPLPATALLEARYGKIGSDNDRCDVALLHAIDRNVSDFLVTQDNGIHRRARVAGLADRVFRVQDAVEWLRNTYNPKEVALPYLVERRCYELDPDDPIFGTLREDYPDFDGWFKKHQMRFCWALEVGGVTAGILIRKEHEPRSETDALLPGEKILKIATFKVAKQYRGEKFGEHLLKQVLWYAQRNGYDLTYVTAFVESQAVLVDLLSQFGFRQTGVKAASGEAILEKQLGRGPVIDVGLDILGLDVQHYPRFVEDSRADVYCIPIQPRWYSVLFPENEAQQGLPFAGKNRAPGNTIRKVYLCRTPTKNIKPGSILLFYVSGNEMSSRAVRTVGIVERMQETSEPDALLRLTGRRSVYSEKDQIEMTQRSGPVKVVDFLLVGHLEKPIALPDLLATEVLAAAPQSIVKLGASKARGLDLHRRLGFW